MNPRMRTSAPYEQRMVSSLNELDRLAKQRNQQSEAEQRIAEKQAFDRRQSQALATAAEINRKKSILLQRLLELGGPDAVIVEIIDSRLAGFPKSRNKYKVVQMAAWLLYVDSRSLYGHNHPGYYVFADGRFGVRETGALREERIVRCVIHPAGSDPRILDALDRLIGKYS